MKLKELMARLKKIDEDLKALEGLKDENMIDADTETLERCYKEIFGVDYNY